VNLPLSPPQALDVDPVWIEAVKALRELYSLVPAETFNPFISELGLCIQKSRLERSPDLKALDDQRMNTPLWYAKPGSVAYTTYIDQFSGTLKATQAKLDYLEALGVTLFHPLPLLKAREGNSDGGFAVVDYMAIDPDLGDISDLQSLALAMNARDIALVLDVVCNHTAQEHVWAQKFRAHDPEFSEFYITVDTASEVEAWEATLLDVFPETAPGNFTYNETLKAYVWTTFYPFQWDLNYANPRVFLEMAKVLLFYANLGVSGFRLDSAPFLWKTKNTIGRNLPQTHLIVRAFKALLHLSAPSVFLLAEAIESIEDVIPYMGSKAKPECDLAYNNVTMTALWGALADQKVDVLAKAIQSAALRPPHTRWLNYVRCHDDIIWQALSQIAPLSRLKAWSDFYSNGKSYAKGLAFQAPPNLPPSTCGMSASLCGGNTEAALLRLKLINAIIYALDGVPLIYMGDEIGLMNDEAFINDPAKRDEYRWLNRPKMDWDKVELRLRSGQFEQVLFDHLKTLKNIISGLEYLGSEVTTAKALTESLICLMRPLKQGQFKVYANFSDKAYPLNTKGEVIFGKTTDGLIGPYGYLYVLEHA
jgi:amylosucrase